MIPHLVRRFYPWATTIIGNSQGVADDLSQLLSGSRSSRDRLRVIYNPVVTAELQQKTLAPLDHAWFQAGQPPVVLAVGRLAEQKDYPTLIRAFAMAQRQNQCPARLMILGEGPQRAALEGPIAQLGLAQDVSLPGFVDNPYPFMSRAGLYVLSSGWEGLPTVLIEALYCGVPVVATDCPSGPREILAGGKYGQLVPVGDVEALGQAIAAALAGRCSRPPVESWHPYRAEVVTDQYINLLF